MHGAARVAAHANELLIFNDLSFLLQRVQLELRFLELPHAVVHTDGPMGEVAVR